MRKALLKMHLAVFLAGFTGPLGKLISLSEGVLVWYRLCITSITLFLLLLFQKQLQWLPFKAMLRMLLTGLLIAIHWTLFYGSIKYSNVSVALVCFSSTSFFTALLEPLMLKTKFDWREVLLSLIAIAGIYIIFHFNSQYHLGIALGLSAAVFAALFTILLRRSLREVPSSKTVSLYVLSGGFISLSLLMPLYLHWLPQQQLFPSGSDWIYLLCLSWLCTVFAFTVALSALKKLSSFTLNLTYNLEPVYGILLAFLLFHENKSLNYAFYIGLALIILSVALQMIRLVGINRAKKLFRLR